MLLVRTGAFAIAVGGGGGGADLTENLVFWYKFNGNLNDSSGNGLTLTKFGDGTLAFAASDLDQALDLSTQDYIVSGDASEINALANGFHIAIVAESPFGNTITLESLATSNILQIFAATNQEDIGIEFAYDNEGSPDVLTLEAARPSPNEPFLLEIFFSQSTNTVGISINNGTFTTTALPGDAMTDFGSLSFGNIGFTGWRGEIDMAAAWSAPFPDLSPTGTERAALWNGGSFRADP